MNTHTWTHTHVHTHTHTHIHHMYKNTHTHAHNLSLTHTHRHHIKHKNRRKKKSKHNNQTSRQAGRQTENQIQQQNSMLPLSFPSCLSSGLETVVNPVVTKKHTLTQKKIPQCFYSPVTFSPFLSSPLPSHSRLRLHMDLRFKVPSAYILFIKSNSLPWQSLSFFSSSM